MTDFTVYCTYGGHAHNSTAEANDCENRYLEEQAARRRAEEEAARQRGK